MKPHALKRPVKIFLAVLGVLLAVLTAAAVYLFGVYKPSLTVDFSQPLGAVSSKASGYLYGIAQREVPSSNMTESVDISSASVKVMDGLQHPVGDVSNVYTQLENADYIVVYLQDIYDTWYYENDTILSQRSEGSYDWRAFVEDDYFPRIRDKITAMAELPCAGQLVFCPYNECDNGVWFGSWVEDANNENGFGGYCTYDEAGAENFFAAWKMTYDFLRELAPDILIGGPGFAGYDSGNIRAFMEYCAQNDCLPDVMIYHELGSNSVYNWQKNAADCRGIMQETAGRELDIIVSEYGQMRDNGLPGKMLQYITQIEQSGTWGDNAFWRLANNLCDVAADYNSPNANWWLYRWYADLEGDVYPSDYQDLFKSNFAVSLRSGTKLSSKGFMGLGTYDADADQITLLAGGRDGDGDIYLTSLDQTALAGQKVRITVEETVYKGLSGIVNSPITLRSYTADVSDELKIKMRGMDASSAYRITVVPDDGSGKDVAQGTPYVRYEFEDGKLLGDAYTYESAYASTGDKKGLVGGIEKDGDGVEVTVEVPEGGAYALNLIFGNSNDGDTPDDRTDTAVGFAIDGQEQDPLVFENTIKSEYTSCKNLGFSLAPGVHTLTFTHDTGTIVFDSLLLTEKEAFPSNAVLPDADRTGNGVVSYLCVAESDGYYDLAFAGEGGDYAFSVDGAACRSNNGKACVYLRRGLNYVDVQSDSPVSFTLAVFAETQTDRVFTLLPEDAVLNGSASVAQDKSQQTYLTGISSAGGGARWNVACDIPGTYRVTVTYANNDEGGAHDYNVDLVERYFTFSVNGRAQNVYCRNTYSWDTYKTVTFNVKLNAGENEIVLTNSGDEKFNGQETFIPNIHRLSLNPVQS